MTQALQTISLNKIDGTPATLAEHAGKVLLVVNVASKCGLTPQYAGLEKLYEQYRDQGLVVLGFPANDFAGQEPGSDAEIAGFCTATFGVQFPMYGKLVATGPGKHPLYAALTAAQPETEDRTHEHHHHGGDVEEQRLGRPQRIAGRAGREAVQAGEGIGQMGLKSQFVKKVAE